MEQPQLYSLEILDQESPKRQLYLSKHQLELLGLKSSQMITLQVGFNTLAVEIAEQTNLSAQTTLYLSSSAFSDLTYYHGESLWLVFRSPNKIVLGPTLGITVSLPTWKKIDKIYAIKKRALLALEKGIFFYCFHLNRVDLKNNLVEAYYFNPGNQQWAKGFFPFPQVLYHRSSYPFNFYAGQDNTNNVYHKLWLNLSIQRINNTYSFDKWTIYQALSFFPETSKFQPETTLLTPFALNRFLVRYRYCYVKNYYGRGGKQVFRVEKTANYFICKAGGSKVSEWKFTGLKRLYRFLRVRLGENLIIQQGIALAHLNERPFDIRVLVQKNINAEWIITALSFRIADSNAVVTNIAAGATEIAVEPGDNKLDSGLSMKLLEDVTLKVLGALEASYGTLGEVGLDIGLDVYGKLWLIEANSQPSSRGYREAATEELCNRIFGLPLEYAKYLVKRMYNNLETD